MTESLVTSIIDMFGSFATAPFGKEVITFVVSLLPVLELRGGLLAAGALNLNPWIAYFIAIIGNLLPIPFILLFLTPIFNWMKKRKFLKKIVDKLEKKAESKRDKFEKGEFIALILFVGIPLPGTGAWTGALIASVMGMNKKKAFLAIVLGVLMASIIMMILSYGILNNAMYH
ncbi:MAG: small multi-drug export protein [Clostridia bacterium]|nr:small multi-drug export protein [Clostridia bacterium]